MSLRTIFLFYDWLGYVLTVFCLDGTNIVNLWTCFVLRWEGEQPEDWWLWQRPVLCADSAHQAGSLSAQTVLYLSSATSSCHCWHCLCLCVQETFDAGLQAFQQEGITNITALKDQLLAAKHIQSKAIEARHAALMKRWNQLLSNSAARKKKLLEAQEHFRKVTKGPPPLSLSTQLAGTEADWALSQFLSHLAGLIRSFRFLPIKSPFFLPLSESDCWWENVGTL